MVGNYQVWICVANIFFIHILNAQIYIKQFVNHSYEQIAVDEQKNIYLLSPKEATLTKFFYNLHYDSSIVVGGNNLSSKESFIKPTDILIPDSKTIFVVDLLANDIKFLNTNLKIQKIWNFNLIHENYQPFQLQTATIAPTGEMFIQNKLNAMIYRVNVFGEIDRVMGGNNFAEASITDYAKLTYTKEGLYVWVFNQNQLFHFDYNTNFKKVFNFSFSIENIFSDYHNLMAYQKSQILLFLKNENFIPIYEHNNEIIDAYLIDNQIYILDKDGIFLFTLKNSK